MKTGGEKGKRWAGNRLRKNLPGKGEKPINRGKREKKDYVPEKGHRGGWSHPMFLPDGGKKGPMSLPVLACLGEGGKRETLGKAQGKKILVRGKKSFPAG